MTIAVDFDGTLAVTDFPLIIGPNQHIIDYIKSQKTMGSVIILNTCRTGQFLVDALKWSNEQGLEFDYVNENSKETIALYGDCRKIFADVNIDDKNVLVESVNKATKKGMCLDHKNTVLQGLENMREFDTHSDGLQYAVDGKDYSVNEIITEIKTDSIVGNKFSQNIYDTVITYLGKFSQDAD